MTIKDFKVGQTVFVMGDGRAQRDKCGQLGGALPQEIQQHRVIHFPERRTSHESFRLAADIYETCRKVFHATGELIAHPAS